MGSLIPTERKKYVEGPNISSDRIGKTGLRGGVIAGFPKSVSRAEFCKRLKYLLEKIPFRDGYIYNNNYMVTMAGYVAESLGQDTWENLMTTRIFQPLLRF